MTVPWAKRAFRKICSKTGGEAPSAGLTAILTVFLVLAEKLRYFRSKSTINVDNVPRFFCFRALHSFQNSYFKTLELLRVLAIPNPKSEIIKATFVCLFICFLFSLSLNNFDCLIWDWKFVNGFVELLNYIQKS